MKSHSPGTNENAVIHLDPNEALVLFELLSRWAEPGHHAPDSKYFHANAECGVLLGVLASLEKQLSASFRSDYDKVLTDAREVLAHLWDYNSLQGQ